MLCVCLDMWDSDKCFVFFGMCGTQTSAVCLLCLFTLSVPSPGCVGLRQVLCVCLMCGTQTSAALKIVEDHPMNIHVQFGFNHICSF